MATPFDTVYKKFLNKISDSQLLSIPQYNLDSILLDYMESAISRFRKCKQDIRNYDTVNETFNVTLTLEEVEILTLWMLYEYSTQSIMRLELLKQSLSSKDFAQYSQANHLNSLLALRDKLYEDASQMAKNYSYDFNDLTRLKNDGN